ncbi:MAG: hypothetical protein RIM99_02665 [Cyclobacteriaceae bacterium]
MQKKLNEDFIDSYCEKFASKVNDSFFTDDKITITGQEILSVTPSIQTNYFIIKLLFRYWQGETKKLESPYFNYEHAEVKEALTEFMNVLSQHIEIHKNGFQMLLNHAVKDALYLAASPQAYVEIDLEDRRVDKIDDAVIEESLKYLKIYKKDIGNFLSDMKGLTIDDVIDELPEEFEQFDSSKGLLEETELLSQILPVKPGQILTDELPDDFEEEDEVFDNDDKIKGKTEPKAEIEEKVESEEVEIPKNMKWEDETVKDFGDSSETSEEEDDGEEIDYDKLSDFLSGPDDEDEESESSDKAEDSEEDLFDSSFIMESGPEDEEEDVAEEPSQEKKEPEVKKETINDQFEAPEKSVADHHAEAKAGSMMELISVNHQFMFVKELFKDDQVSFQNALYELEEYDTFDDAVEFLVQGYAKEFKWDMQSTEVKELLKVLFRKFRD